MKTEFDRKATWKYLLFTFSVAWLIQIGVWLISRSGYAAVAQLIMAAMMFVPMLGVLVSGKGLRGMGWTPRIKGNVAPILISWFVPAILTAIGAALYFILFPGQLDLSGESMKAAEGGAEALAQLESQGITYPMYVLINTIAAVTYAPLINMIAAVGEEAGWRGFLYPQLKARFGRKPGWLLGGIIWGMWHWPLIGLIGYEYGTEYFGFPITGMLLFLLFTVALGIIADRLYERSRCIWIPALLHGAVNAAAGIPLVISKQLEGSLRLLGPAPNGLIAGLPLVLAALVILLVRQREKAQ